MCCTPEPPQLTFFFDGRFTGLGTTSLLPRLVDLVRCRGEGRGQEHRARLQRDDGANEAAACSMPGARHRLPSPDAASQPCPGVDGRRSLLERLPTFGARRRTRPPTPERPASGALLANTALRLLFANFVCQERFLSELIAIKAHPSLLEACATQRIELLTSSLL